MLYVGSVPRKYLGTGQLAECVDPALPRGRGRPDPRGTGTPYPPAYHSLSPAQRSGYLSWLAGGRWAPQAAIGYVFLCLYGLERRVLIDARWHRQARTERPQILAEVTRLLRIYGGNSSFHAYAASFEQYLKALVAGRPPVRYHPANASLSTMETRPPSVAATRAPGSMAEPASTLVLDRELIEAKLAETAAVSALLADLFADPAESAVHSTPPGATLVNGLDADHSRLARRLAEHPQWTEAALEELCRDLGLLREGALDAVNEAALDVADEPLIENCDEEFRINHHARGALLA